MGRGLARSLNLARDANARAWTSKIVSRTSRLNASFSSSSWYLRTSGFEKDNLQRQKRLSRELSARQFSTMGSKGREWSGIEVRSPAFTQLVVKSMRELYVRNSSQSTLPPLQARWGAT